MRKIMLVVCCITLAVGMVCGSFSASAAETAEEIAGAVAETEVSGETLDSGGFTFNLSSYYKTATINGFSQKVYAARGNKNYSTDHILNIPSEVEGNDGTKYPVTEIEIYDSGWKDGKENLTFTKVTIPKTIIDIHSTFSEIESLKYVDFEEGSSMYKLPSCCFKNCVNLERIGVGNTDKLPESITRIEGQSFNGCKSLKSITLPDGIIYMGGSEWDSNKDCFNGCTNLKSIVIPASIESLGVRDFMNCSSLESVVFKSYKEGDKKGKNNLSYLNTSTFENCTSLKEIVMPNGISSIGDACFKNTAIESITIPNSVQAIGKESFADTPLTGINLPELCSKVEQGAFARTKLNENGLKTPDGKSYGIAFVCKTVEIDYAFSTVVTNGWGNVTEIIDTISPTIASYKNSNADTYAIENDMEFVSLGNWNPCKVTYKGDIDDDGTTDLIDVVRLQQHVNGWKDIEINVDACDCNGDGVVNLLDVVRLKQYVNKWDVPIY